MFSLAGPEAGRLLTELGAEAPGPNEVRIADCQGCPVLIAGGSGLAAPGYTIIVDETVASELYRSLILKVAARHILLMRYLVAGLNHMQVLLGMLCSHR